MRNHNSKSQKKEKLDHGCIEVQKLGFLPGLSNSFFFVIMIMQKKFYAVNERVVLHYIVHYWVKHLINRFFQEVDPQKNIIDR